MITKDSVIYKEKMKEWFMKRGERLLEMKKKRALKDGTN